MNNTDIQGINLPASVDSTKIVSVALYSSSVYNVDKDITN